VGGWARLDLVTSRARKEEIDLILGGSYVEPDRTCITPLPGSSAKSGSEELADFSNDDIGGMKFIDESS
jgi:hypothetical protein